MDCQTTEQADPEKSFLLPLPVETRVIQGEQVHPKFPMILNMIWWEWQNDLMQDLLHNPK